MSRVKNHSRANAAFVLASLSSLLLAACSDIKPRSVTTQDLAFAATTPMSYAAYEQIHGWEK
ncbi:hypothetical protein AA23498_1932 [Acetobacter nitrogenifigens DSM 23921 = NBRC 105050]|uniref:hypothetical protein n=1 Tax=Acetobacter nitrogenifigens TaxID=285268 RepID=UPI0011BE78F7|nr:hypothetical protein [Acetobacter nitrogenifigens]GBQ94133.1 hypothetical protein AA23498_1932 [Acetobacter nitrogenifigens DSM 23921 = NBRC 105050]